MNAQCDPGRRGTCVRGSEPYLIMHVKSQINVFHWTLDSHPTDFTVALYGMTIANREKGLRYRNRQIKRAASDQFFAIEIATAEAWWCGQMDPWFVRWHAHDAHKRRKRECVPILISPGHCSGVERPDERAALL